jgi:O-antigen ligase
MAGVAVIEASWHGPSPRATVFNANPILLARVSGFAILVLCLLYWQGRLRVWLFAPAAGMASIGLLASGTKAPLLGLLLTVFAITPFFLMQSANRTRIWGTLLVGCAGLAATLAFLASAKFYFARRIAGALTGARGFTSDTRLTLWQLTLDMIPMHPLGLGWGRFSEWIRVFENGQLMRHPHNMALEIFLEAGWLAGAAFLALVAASLYRGLRAAYQDTARIGGSASPDLLLVLAGLMYWMVCAAFSGDVNDNRPFWALLGMALAALGSRRTAKADSVDGRVEARDG